MVFHPHGDTDGSAAAPPTAQDLLDYFHNAAKPRSEWRVGLEQEKIGVLATGAPVPYDAAPGAPSISGSISGILERMIERGFVAKREDGHILELVRGAERITVEPGGQLELSGPALATASGCRDALLAHVAEVSAIARPMG